MRRAWTVVLALALLALLPDAVYACPVCFDSSDENRQAFLATTAFMSLLPLGLVFGSVAWLRRKSREQDELYGEGPREE